MYTIHIGCKIHTIIIKEYRQYIQNVDWDFGMIKLIAPLAKMFDMFTYL